MRDLPHTCKRKTGVDVNTSSACFHLIPSALIVSPEKTSLFLRPGVGRAHEKGITDAAICATKKLKFMYNLCRMGNPIIR